MSEASPKPPPRVLTIAGSDSSGGAGIQADIKTIAMLGGYAMTAITTITAQNSVGVHAIAPMAGDVVYKQITACLDDIGVDAIKIGMLHDEEIIDAVAEALDDVDVPIVVDPVMVATSGDILIAPLARRDMVEKIFPLASLVTPNLPELGYLTDSKPKTSAEMIEQAEKLCQQTGAAILAKGGHTEDDRIIDILIPPGARAVQFDHARIDTRHTHGTGCTLSSAIATLLGHGQGIEHAVRLGRNFVVQAIKAAPGFGQGHGPMGHHAVRSLN